MKRVYYFLSVVLMGALVSCGGSGQQGQKTEAVPEVPEYVVVENPQVDISAYEVDENGYITLFDGKTFTPISFHTPEAGPHFYAPQTFLDDKGRRIIIGWLNSWEKQVQTSEEYTGALSIPREIKMIDGKLCTFPVSEAVGLLNDDDKLVSIKKDSVTITAPDLSFPLEYKSDIEKVDILRDTKTIELFINDGEASFTYWFGV
jgi:sucrose-6-phosphate hydrolase SacC (GH32 family)